MPFSCLMMLWGSTPERKEREHSRATASLLDAAQPPPLPIWVNSSHRPSSSSLMVT